MLERDTIPSWSSDDTQSLDSAGYHRGLMPHAEPEYPADIVIHYTLRWMVGEKNHGVASPHPRFNAYTTAGLEAI